MARTQANRSASLATDLGDDVLLLKGFVGKEELGRPFQFKLDLLSEDHNISFDDIVGTNVTLRLNLNNDETRYINGYVVSFSQASSSVPHLAQYHAVVVPWLSLLTRTADCKIRQNMSVPDIVKEVFRYNGFSDFEEAITGSYRQWEYSVQYRESAFNYASRLMEQEGIYYYFQHEQGKHSLIFSDSQSSHDPFPGYDTIPFNNIGQSHPQRDFILDFNVQQTLQTGKYVLNDYDFTVPTKPLLTKANIPRQHAKPDYEVFDYPGEYSEYNDGEHYSRMRLEELQTQHEVVRGTTNATGLCTGYWFEMTDHPREDWNRKYLVTSTSYHYETDEYYSSSRGGGQGPVFECHFTAMADTEQFRPARITVPPLIQGPQTATVVGSGDIHPDKYGRVKVQFHWDRYGTKDANSSCWVRVSQFWAGPGWGSMHIPHIGQEVIVEFLEGDPDHPIITGRVYNNDNMPPLDLPANKTKSIIRDHGNNEITLEGKDGSQQVYIYSPVNNTFIKLGDGPGIEFNTDGDHNHYVKGDRIVNIDGSVNITINVDKTENTTGNKTENTTGDKKETTNGNKQEVVSGYKKVLLNNKLTTITASAKMSQNLSATSTSTVGLTHSLFAGGKASQTYAYSLSHTKGYTHTFSTATELKKSANKKEDIEGYLHTKCGGGFFVKAKNVVLNASNSIALKCGSSKIILKSGGDIEIKGTKITINGSAKTEIKGGSGSGKFDGGGATIKGPTVKMN